MDFKEVNEFLYEVIAAAENLVRFYIRGSVFSCTKNYVLGSEYLIEKLYPWDDALLIFPPSCVGDAYLFNAVVQGTG